MKALDKNRLKEIIGGSDKYTSFESSGTFASCSVKCPGGHTWTYDCGANSQCVANPSNDSTVNPSVTCNGGANEGTHKGCEV